MSKIFTIHSKYTKRIYKKYLHFNIDLKKILAERFYKHLFSHTTQKNVCTIYFKSIKPLHASHIPLTL